MNWTHSNKLYEKLFEKYEEPLNELYIKTIKDIFENGLQTIGQKVLEQYDELIDTAIEKIDDKEWDTHAEKRMQYLSLLDIDKVEKMYEYVEELDEDDEEIGNHYYRHSFHVEMDDTEEFRREIETAYCELVGENFAQNMVKVIKQTHSKLIRRLKVTDQEMIDFLEHMYDDHYEWLSNEIEGFDDLHYDIPYSYSDFKDFPKHYEDAKKQIQQELDVLQKELVMYDNEMEQILVELTLNEHAKIKLENELQEILLKTAHENMKMILESIEKVSKNPNEIQKVLLAMKEYEQKEWSIEDMEQLRTVVKLRKENREKEYIDNVYYSYMNERKRVHELDEDTYDMLQKEVSLKDSLHLYEILNVQKKKTVQEWMRVEETKELATDIAQLVHQFLHEIDKLKMIEGKWIKEVLGPSVFETYKKNHPDKIVIHVGLTNTGKTYHALQRLKTAEKGLYLAPLRLLALEISECLNAEGTVCSLKTGEEEKSIEHATHTSSTVEMCRLDTEYDIVVIDECQMIGDEERGSAWVRAILGVQTKELHIITAPEGLSIIEKILSEKEYHIQTYRRETELEILPNRMHLKNIQKGDAVIVFSRLNVLKVAKQLENKGLKPAVIYGSMPPTVRFKQVEYFHKGEFDVVVATDAIGMGLNLPVKRVLFMETSKYDGKSRRNLKTSELRQIGGRAGRKGMFDVGYVGFMENGKWAKETMLKNPSPIKKIVIAPTFEMFVRFVEALEMECEVKALKLFIHYWRTYKPSEDFVRIYDMKHQFSLVNKMQQYENKQLMTLEQIWRFVHVPVQYDNNSLLDVWKKNVKALITEEEPYELEIKNPQNLNQLEELEVAYKKIDVHLAFCMDGDVQFRYYDSLKEEISEKIFVMLTKKIQNLTKKCKHCTRRLPLTDEYPMCQKCYQNRYQNHRRNYYDEVYW